MKFWIVRYVWKLWYFLHKQLKALFNTISYCYNPWFISNVISTTIKQLWYTATAPISVLLYPFIDTVHQVTVNVIMREVECGECLCEIWKIKMRRLVRVVCSPCSVLVLHPSAEHLQLQFYWNRGRVWWVSVWNMKDKDETVGESSMLTLFCFSASPKCWAPSAPIWF
jgi:hypothetical protein